jgi:hypothetical protein
MVVGVDGADNNGPGARIDGVKIDVLMAGCHKIKVRLVRASQWPPLARFQVWGAQGMNQGTLLNTSVVRPDPAG